MRESVTTSTTHQYFHSSVQHRNMQLHFSVTFACCGNVEILVSTWCEAEVVQILKMILGKNYWCADSPGLQVCKSESLQVCKCRTPLFHTVSELDYGSDESFLTWILCILTNSFVVTSTDSHSSNGNTKFFAPPPPLSFLLPIVHPLGRTFFLSPVFHCLKNSRWKQNFLRCELARKNLACSAGYCKSKQAEL